MQYTLPHIPVPPNPPVVGSLSRAPKDPETEDIPPETFLSLVHEPMDFGRIAVKLRAVEADVSMGDGHGQGAGHGSSLACSSEGQRTSGKGGAGPGEHFTVGDGREDRSAGNLVDGVHVVEGNEDGRPHDPAGRSQLDGAVAMPYSSVPAFARDMNLVFSNVRRVWPMGNPGSDNRLTKAADSLKLAFDTRWRALAPHLHSIQVRTEEGRVFRSRRTEAQDFGDDSFSITAPYPPPVMPLPS